MSHFNKIVQTRRSTRKFTQELLNPDEVELILKAGLMSPSSKNRTPWEFVVVEEKEQLVKLAKCKGHGSALIEGATMAVVVIGDALTSDVWIEDASIASILMQMQAEDLGIGSCWVQLRLRETEYGLNSEEFVKEILEIPHHLQALSIIAFGRKAESKPAFDETKLKWEKIHIGKW